MSPALRGIFFIFTPTKSAMDTISTLYQKYIASLSNDISAGCITPSRMTQELLAFYQEVVFRTSAIINDQVTANQLLTYTATYYK